MFQPSLEKLFDRYRRRGDAAALGLVFDRTSGELHKLALHLVRDAAEADDVLQNTYLAAIESAPSYDSSRPLVPWLVGILANQAALARRRARREIEPDRVDQRGERPPNEAADLAEFSSKLGEALAKLPEPYAEVLRLHLADGKKSVEIARELGREPGTVRMQVHRGLDLLRRALPAGFATGAVVASLGGPARAAVRERVLAEAARHGATIGGAGAGAGGAVLGAKLGTKLVAALAASLAVLGVVAYLAWPERAIEPSGASTTAATTAELARPSEAAQTPRSELASVAAEPSTPRDAESAPSAVEPGGPWLVGTVKLPAHLAVDATTLEVRAVARGRVADAAPLFGRVDAFGRFKLDVGALFATATRDNPLEELCVRADHPLATRGEARVRIAGVEARATYAVGLELDEAGVVVGRARGPSGLDAPIEVGLLALCDGVPCLPMIDRVPVGADGAFRLRSTQARECLLVAFAVGAVPVSRVVGVRPGAPLDVGELALDAGLEIDGLVTRAGTPVEHAVVGIAANGAPGAPELVLPLFGVRLAWRDGALHRTGAMVETDEHGRFRSRGFEPGSHELEVVRGEGGPLRGVSRLSPKVRVEAPGSVVLEVASARLELEVLDADGRPARGSATVDGAKSKTPARLDEHGRVRLDVAPFERRSVTLEAEGQRTETFEFEAPGPGETRTERVELLRDRLLASLELTLATHGDDELELDFVALDGDAETPTRLVRRVTASGGRATVADLPAGAWRVHAFVGNSYRHFAELYAPIEFELSLAPAEHATRALAFARAGRVRVDVQDEHGARIAATCNARDGADRKLSLRFVARGAERVGSAEGRISELAPNDVYPNLPPGDYVFEFVASGRERVERRVRVVAGETSELSIVLPKSE
ncbi:MAG: sigma-70 family RNA polymerase sigma factor [Planctomycetes bacterium]|nr:sigma-70 family RNA polymerase sigma factor [Planctomycetota bacterium]